MTLRTHSIATARSCSNIAFIKYWGNRDDDLRIPANDSISMNLAGIETVTTVRFAKELASDRFVLNGRQTAGPSADRTSRHLDRLRERAGVRTHAEVISHNNFPTGAGIASSASGFAAVTAAGCAALGLDLAERELSALARLGSGSASRSIPSGFVEWHAGTSHEDSFAVSIAGPDYWPLADLIAVISQAHKPVGSTEGHSLAPTSPLQEARLADAPRRLEICRAAIQDRNFSLLAEVLEEDALIMHAVMMTSRPALIYWQPATLAIMQAVRGWRAEGLAAAFTIDAGPNVHILCQAQDRAETAARLAKLDGINMILEAAPGGPTELLDQHLTA